MSAYRHTLDIYEQFADAIYDGRKTFEIRNVRRGIQVGDKIRFNVIRKGGLFTLNVDHPLNELLFEVVYLLPGWGLNDDHVAFSIRPCAR